MAVEGFAWGLTQNRTLQTALAMAAAAGAAIAMTWVFIARAPSSGAIGFSAICDVLALYSLFLGAVVALRRPGNVVGVLLALFGLVMSILAASSAFDEGYALQPHRFWVSPYYVATGQVAWMLWYIPPALLMLYFPTGRLLSRRWRIVVIGLTADFLLGTVSGALSTPTFDPPYDKLANPFPVATGVLAVILDVIDVGVFLLGLLASLVACLVAMIIRFRRSSGDERAQLKWFALGAGALPSCLLVCWLALLVFGNDDILGVGLLLMLLSVPTATTIGLLRYRLYDVDRAVAATVTYALVTVLVIGLFAIASFLGGLVLDHSSPTVAAAATALCALALSPLHRRLRRLVDRRFYPMRRRVLLALTDLRSDIHRGAAVPEQLEPVLRKALADPGLRVGFRSPGSSVDVDLAGHPVTEPGLPVMLADEPVGVLITNAAVSRALLKETAQASALVIEVIRLRAGLTSALRDVESSRLRLVHASYEERRRLERDLHDGAQQRLVALGMNVRLAQRHLGDGTVDVHHLLDGAVDELAAAVTDLRHIAHGLRPSSLDDGLGSALSNLLGRLPVPVAVSIDDGPLPDDVATTAFFVTSEAVTNAIKHAAADHIAVDIRRQRTELVVQVSDDGRGGATLTAGTGLAGLTDRVAALGGSLTVGDRTGRGTLVRAVLPCAS